MKPGTQKDPRGNCNGCGIPIADGYTIGSHYAPNCPHCSDRRASRLRRGQTTSPTGYAGELIDNTDPKGRIIAA